MAVLNRLFMIVVIIFQITYTNPIPLYLPFTFRRSILVVQVIYVGTLPSWNISCAILTKASHLVLYGFFSRLDFMSHISI